MNKDSWEILKLVDICLFFNDGNWIESKDQSESGIRLIQTGNIGNGYYINKEARAKFISEDTFKNLKCTEVFEGDCLVSRLPDPIGRACIVPLIKGRAITSVDCSILRFKPNILASYFVYFSQCKKYTLNIKKSSTGSTRKRISRSNLGNILVPIPPLPIQAKIVKELDTLSDIITKKKEQLAELDKLAQATFYDMFGDPLKNEKYWETEKLENICSSIVRGPFGSTLKKDFFVQKSEFTYKVYEQKHAIQKDAFIGQYYIDELLYKSLKRFTVLPKDIIMSCSGTIGEFFEIPANAERGIINQALLKFTLLENKIINIFFLFLMKQLIINVEKKGSGIQNIGSVKFIKDITLGLPPISLQNQFAEKIKAIEQKKSLINQSITDVQLLFDYTMDKYFN